MVKKDLLVIKVWCLGWSIFNGCFGLGTLLCFFVFSVSTFAYIAANCFSSSLGLAFLAILCDLVLRRRKVKELGVSSAALPEAADYTEE